VTASKPLPRVLHVCKVYLPTKGGVQRVVQLITGLLKDFDHHILTTGNDGAITEQQLGNTLVSRCRSFGQLASMPIAPSLVLKLIREFKKHQLIAIHYPFPLADLGTLFCLSRVPIVVHWHSNIVAQRYLRWLVAPITLLMLIRASAIVVTDPAMLKNSFWLRLFKKKIRFIPYGIEQLNTTVTPLAEAPFFVLVGRHVSYKGMDIAMRALQHCQARLKIIGNGPLFDRHEQLAADLALGQRIEFIRYADDVELNNQLANSIGLVVSSNLESEAFALVQLEAMRIGKPVINTSLNSSVPSVARNEIEALTVPPNDALALGLAMQKLLDQPTLAQNLGAAGKQRFEARFLARQFRDAVNALYKSVMQPRSS
jgi:glycosyltransferase involved in cell wall biosynthesis